MPTNSNRFIVPGPLPHTPPIFHKFKLLTIFDYKLQLGNLVYESINGIGPVNWFWSFKRITIELILLNPTEFEQIRKF